MRQPAEITKKSAVHIAKWRISEMLKADKNLPWAKQIALKMALQEGGAIEEIADILWEAGLHITIDLNSEEHQEWLKPPNPAVELDKE